MKTILIAFMVWLIMTGCWKVSEVTCTNANDPTTCVTADNIPNITEIHASAVDVLNALKNKDVTKLWQLISKDWVRFSAYSNVNVGSDVVFKIDDFKETLQSQKEYTRWTQDWSGDPIVMTFDNYRARYIYNGNYVTEWTAYINTKVQRGNTINNIYDIYTWNAIIEYYIPGKSKLYENMDRKSLTLVFDKESGIRKLKAIIHGERTI
jgi:hypothetical protein